MTNIAAIDCGTNSIRLLISRVDSEGNLTEITRRMIIVRLGEGVDATGKFSDAALTRVFAACDEYAELIKTHEVEEIRFIATSASRDVSNRDVFAKGVKDRLGCELEVISGETEAELSFAGATFALAKKFPGPYLVLDIGGGSTEFVLGTDKPDFARSVNIGCVRMTERHLNQDPPTSESIAAATKDIEDAITLAAEVVPLEKAVTVIGLAGSVTTVAAMALGLDKYDREAIHASVISAQSVHQTSDRFLSMTREQRAALPYMHPGRVDVIGAGALVLDRIVHRLNVESIVVSEQDILDGIAISIAKKLKD
jgi:exopolyphosphatase/guanosine-5'-triphosphate,3'-diphosphate pyrophosphatase